MTRLTDEQIDALDRLEREATPGEWLVHIANHHNSGSWRAIGPVHEVAGADEMARRDSRFIAASRNHLRTLIDEVRRYREGLTSIAAWMERSGHERAAGDVLLFRDGQITRITAALDDKETP